MPARHDRANERFGSGLCENAGERQLRYPRAICSERIDCGRLSRIIARRKTYEAGYRVFFTTVANLIAVLTKAHAEGWLHKRVLRR